MTMENRSIQIAKHKIGKDEAPFIIAEVGINHEGSVEKALQMVDAAVAAGADCIKFQCHIAEAEMIPTDMTPGLISKERLWNIIERCELSEQEERYIQDYCGKKGITYLCTPFSREAADRLLAMNIPAFKIGSGECNNIPLLKHIAKMGRPILLSTGMNTLDSIRNSVRVIQNLSCPLILLHCNSLYPTPYSQVRLGVIQELEREFSLPVGFSDHSIGIYTALGAVALGACVIEKHYTLSRNWPGPDISLSIEPHELGELVKGAKAIYEARGGKKTILSDEQPIIDFAYASVVSTHEIVAGEVFSESNLWVKRPGTGKYLAQDLEFLIGQRARINIPAETQISPEHIAE